MLLNLEPYLAAIEDELQSAVCTDNETYRPLYAMMRYHLGWQDATGRVLAGRRGKRLRPLLCLLACEAVGGDWRSILPAAAAIELIHNFSLIHDDIEDNSALRHQRPTVWTVWGLAQGINTGDAMWALARQSVYWLAARGHSADRVLAAAQRIDETCLALCHGQFLDISFEGNWAITVKDYEEMIAGKTAALVMASLGIGAALGAGPAATVSLMEQFGRQMGLAFQMTDDLLGIWGNPQVTGKSAASDLAARKMTLPVLYALAWEREHGASTLLDLLAAPCSAPALEEMVAILDASGARAAVAQRAADCEQAMLAAWHAMALTGPAGDTLLALAQSIVGREY